MTVVSNVIAIDFRTPVVTDYVEASRPKSEIAHRLAAEAQDHVGKLSASPDKKAGTLRILSSGRGDIFHINPYLISIKDGWNCRELNDPENLAHIDDLARSIAEIGVQEALTVVVEGDAVFVTDGHCRLLATFRAVEVYGAEIKSIPLRVEGRLTSPADHVLRQLLSGKPKTPYEMGNAFVKLIGFGWNVKQIATKAGLTGARVSQILDLIADSNDGIKAMVASGQVSATEAAKVLRHAAGDAAAAEKTLSSAVTVAQAAGKKRATAQHVKAVDNGETITRRARTVLYVSDKATKVEATDKAMIITVMTTNAIGMAKLKEAIRHLEVSLKL